MVRVVKWLRPRIVILIVWVQLPLVTPKNFYAKIAQLVERQTENLCVGGSIPSLGTKNIPD